MIAMGRREWRVIAARGLVITETTPVQHDRVMSVVQVLNHFQRHHKVELPRSEPRLSNVATEDPRAEGAHREVVEGVLREVEAMEPAEERRGRQRRLAYAALARANQKHTSQCLGIEGVGARRFSGPQFFDQSRPFGLSHNR